MRRLRLLLVIVAFAVASLAAYLSQGFLQKPPEQPAPVIAERASVDVLVAGRDIPPGERLGSTGLQWRAWPSEGLAKDMITRDGRPDALEQLKTARAKLALVAGEPILATRIVPPGESGFLSAILPNGLVAVSITVTELTSVSGFVLPNDRVDVIFTRQVTDRAGNRTASSEAVLTNVKVLAINQILASGTAEPAISEARLAVLELEPLQAEVLGRLVAAGQISLALRSVTDDGDRKPQLADAYRNPNRAKPGVLVVRYGLERQLPGR